MIKRIMALLCMLCLMLPAMAYANDGTPEGYYQPAEISGLDDPDSRWCWDRSRQSEHFFCFWEAGFGDNPNSDELPESMRVDVDDLLDKAEHFYSTNMDRVGMAVRGSTRLDELKLQIYLLYTDEWVATGSGHDDVIGALWVSPMTCQPAGFVIAHEIAHCFQYQVYCDKLMLGETDGYDCGFRYGFGADLSGGNTFWEQCAQWVALLDYPEEAQSEMGDWPELYNLAFQHEWMRYNSFLLMNYWAERHGEAAIGELWRESRSPEDALTAWCRLYCGGDTTLLGDELFEYAVSLTGTVQPATFYDAGDGWLQVAYADCPGTAGCCLAELPLGTTAVEFEGLHAGSVLAADDPGVYRVTDAATDEPTAGGTVRSYNAVSAGQNWRYGMAALNSDGNVIATAQGHDGVVELTPPADAAALYLVVVGTPDTLTPNPWDDDERTDVQYPFRYRVESESQSYR